MDKIAFVCQRYGIEVNGGAETECREYAEHLISNFQVEILTTCAIDYSTWKNEYPAGESIINGVLVRRFETAHERSLEFDTISKEVIKKHSDRTEKEWMEAQGPFCPSLLKFLAEHGEEYKAVFFMTYLYYTTACGITTNFAGQKILIPTAHDEWPIYLNLYREVFKSTDKIIYNSLTEKAFVEKMFPSTIDKPSITIGMGIDEPNEISHNIKSKYTINNKYIIYCGRIDESKGCKELFNYFIQYKKRNDNKLLLVLTGKATMPIPQRDDIISLGFVSEADKYALMEEAEFFVLASEFESLSISLLESMIVGTPVLVNGKCEVLKQHCILSNAGLFFSNYYEFEACMRYYINHPSERKTMSENGKKYVKSTYNWDNINRQLLTLINS